MNKPAVPLLLLSLTKQLIINCLWSLCFSDPIAQLAVDNTRNILFSRSERGTIQVNLQDPVTDTMISTYHTWMRTRLRVAFVNYSNFSDNL